MKIRKIWFDERFLYGEDESGSVFRQSLLWYRALRNADEKQREHYRIGFEGIHWPDLNVDVSFESFTYKDAMPTPFQEFFLKHNEINISGTTLMASSVLPPRGFSRYNKHLRHWRNPIPVFILPNNIGLSKARGARC